VVGRILEMRNIANIVDECYIANSLSECIGLFSTVDDARAIGFAQADI